MMDAIFGRRSVRKYRDTPIPDEAVTTLLRAAMRAPSAGNRQPWEFVVVRDRQTLLKIAQDHPYAGMLREASLAIVVCGDLERQISKDYDFWVQDCSAATQNLLLEAVHLGIGAVWLGVHPIEERVSSLKALLGLPGHVTPLCVVALGYPAEQPQPIDTFAPARVHQERW